MRFAAFLVVFTASCGGLWRANDPAPLTEDREVDPHAIRAIGDLQIAFSVRFVGATDGAPMLTIWLRNEGDLKILVDVARLRIFGEGPHGARELELVDPRGELGPLHVEPGVVGRERIQLADNKRVEGELSRICVDATPIVSGTTAKEDAGRVCFVRGDGAYWRVSW